jgi:hypothetical protein
MTRPFDPLVAAARAGDEAAFAAIVERTSSARASSKEDP